DDDGIQTAAKIVQAIGQRHYGHDFGSSRDDETGVAGQRAFFLADINGDPAQGAVIHVHGARPSDLVRIKAEIVAMKEVSIKQRGKQVVRRGDGMKVAVKVQVDLLAGFDLRQPSAGSAAFHAEYRPK